MRRDEDLLAAFRRAELGPAWRVYTWDGPAVTFGHFMTPPVLPEPVGSARRVSGGGYVPHGADLTYCVVRERRAGAANYEDIVVAVTRALNAFGVKAEVWRAAARGRDGFCFASLAPFDIHVNGKKLAGCAQRRYSDAVLHHGSIANGVPPEPLPAAGFYAPAGNVTVTELLGRRLSAQEFGEALGDVLGVTPTFRF